MRVLELCAGYGGISKAFRERGHTAITIDIDKEVNPDICIDIMEWEPNGQYFDVVWAAPNCNSYSVMTMGRNWINSSKPRTMNACNGSKLLVRCLEIIADIQPLIWMIENPRAMMRNHLRGGGIIRNTTSQCQYGKKYQKYTDIFSNYELPLKPGCKNGSPCHTPAPRGSTTGTQGCDMRTSAAYPDDLCRHIVLICEDIWEREVRV